MELQVCSAVNNIIEDKTGQSVATCWGSKKKKEALAAELVRRWNAFEKDFRVDLVVNAESLKQQRDDLLVACKRTLGAMTCDELNNGQVFDDDLRKEVKEQAYAAIAKCEA